MENSSVALIARRAIIAITIVVLASGSSCSPIPDLTDDAVGALDSAIDALNRNSAAYQDILNRLLDEIPPNAAASTRASIENIVGNTTGLAGENFQCQVDIVGVRAKKLLERIKQDLLNQPVGPTPPPLICQITPPVVDLKLAPDAWEEVHISGYGIGDVDDNGKQLDYRMIKSDGTVGSFMTGAGAIAHSSRYKMTLDLSGPERKALMKNVNRLAAYWNNQRLTDQGDVIVQAWVPARRTRTIPLGITTLQPKHTGGDKDFDTDGNDPTSLDVKAKIIITEKGITGVVSMIASEDHGDYTKVSGSKKEILYTSDPGYKIVTVNPRGPTIVTRKITSHGKKTIPRPADEAVSELRVWVDQKGDEAGSYTRMDVVWKTVTIFTEQTKPDW